MRRVGIGVLVAAVLMVLVSTAQARVIWVVRGAGFGHGVGMSAYGAYGYGKHGFGERAILHHYFHGVAITELRRPRSVRVLLEVSSRDVVFTRAATACGRRLRGGATYRARRSGSSVRLLTGSGAVLARCGRRLKAQGGPIRVKGLGAYRGALDVVPASSGLYVINEVGLEDYVRGTLPSEVPVSWPNATLRAMGIAMRSIALSTDVRGKGFELYPDTRTQVYGGVRAEAARTDRAVDVTRHQVVTYAGHVAQTTYFSSSGGRTESTFLGEPHVPYLHSVDDPYDYYSPLHRWTLRFSQAEMNSRLSPYLKGSLRAIRVTQRGDSPRINYAKLIGTDGTKRIRGDTLAAALGLYDRWAYFKKVTG